MSVPIFDFDPALVWIERHRFSATQGEVSVFYDGDCLGRYGDDIKMVVEGAHRGEYHGRDDAYWIDVAKRQAIKRNLVCDDTSPAKQTFKISVAMNIRAYGVVEIEAASIEEAQAKLTHEYIGENFYPHGSGSDDYDMGHPEQVSLTEWEDESGNAGELHVELPDPAEVVLMAAGLHGVTRADLALIGDMRHDTDGNPCVWTNSYECDCGTVWDDNWSCQCDDTCPNCGKDVSPHTSEFDTSIPEPLQRLWEMLPEAG